MALDLAFSIADYAIFGLMLIISFGIGVYHALKSSKNNEEFVMGSRSLGKFFIISTEFDKNISDWSYDCTDHKNYMRTKCIENRL